MRVTCRAPIPGRFVVIQIPGESSVLALCEVRVFATPGKLTHALSNTVVSAENYSNSFFISLRTIIEIEMGT